MTALIGEIKYIFDYLVELIQSASHLVLWICSLFLFAVTFNKEYLEIILFKKKVDGLIEILNLFMSGFIIFFEQIFRYVLFLAHLLHILSILRMIEIFKNTKENISNDLLIKSFGLIFYDIFILTFGYVSTILLPPVFIFTNINIITKLCKNNHGYQNHIQKYF